MPDNPPLTRGESPEPVVGYDKPEHLAGNWTDDDPIALDQYFEAQDVGPERYDGLQIPQNKLPVAGRLISNLLYFPANSLQARQIMPADLNRKHVSLSGYKVSDGAVCGLLVSGEYFSLPATGTGFANIVPAKANYYHWKNNLSFALATLDDYTGPIWVLPYDGTIDMATTDVFLQALAVTS